MYLNKQDTEDISQQAYVIALENNNYSPAFASGVKRNLKFNLFRSKKAYNKFATLAYPLLHQPVYVDTTPILVEQIMNLVAELPQHYQDALITYMTSDKLDALSYQNKKNALQVLRNLVLS